MKAGPFGVQRHALTRARCARCELYFPKPGEPVVLLRTGVLLHLRRCMQALGLEPPDAGPARAGASPRSGPGSPARPLPGDDPGSAPEPMGEGPLSPRPADGAPSSGSGGEPREAGPSPDPGGPEPGGSVRAPAPAGPASARATTSGSSGGGRTPERGGLGSGSGLQEGGAWAKEARSGSADGEDGEDGDEADGGRGDMARRGRLPAGAGSAPGPPEAPPVPEAAREAVRAQWEALRAAVAALRPFERFRVVSVAYRRCASSAFFCVRASASKDLALTSHRAQHAHLLSNEPISQLCLHDASS